MILTITLNAAIDKRYVVRGARQGEVNRVRECEYTPGGKGLNVSKVLKISGADVLASGFLGGYAGKYIEYRLNEMGIANDFYYAAGESRSCINIWDEDLKQQTEYLEPGFMVIEAEMSGFWDKFIKQMENAKVITISGSVPHGVPKDIYKSMIAEAVGHGKKVILDSNGELLKQGLTAKPTMIKPNIDEIRMLTGKDCNDMETLIDAAQQLHEQGIAYVVISLGGSGSLLIGKEGTFQAVIPEIDAVNTVGCGDAMVAGLAIGLSRGYDASKMLKTASSIATAAAMSEFTGYYEISKRDRIYPMIEIKSF